MPKNVGDAAAPAGATTDIHFTLLPFISGTGEPVLCAIIFKSDLHVSQIPVSWKTGINITQDANNINLVASGGPTCFYLGKEIPCFYGTSPKACSPTYSIFVIPATNGTPALEFPMPLMSGKLLMPAP